MFLRVVILIFAAICCTAWASVICEKQSAWERSGKFEGDIMLSEEQLRNGMINPASRWPNKTVPFVMDSVFDVEEQIQIIHAIEEYHKKTPIRFKIYDSFKDLDYIIITGKEDGCWSYVGHQGGRQQLNLQRGDFGCLSHDTIIHELLHALGFYHQQNVDERDNYVKINWTNIEEGKERYFEKYDASTTTSFGVPYDYDSVMHYGPCAFSTNGLPTIEPKDTNATIGQRDGLSAKDIEKLEKMYTDVCEKQSAWERSGKFEGDIMLTGEQMRNGMNNTARRWPNKVVPFVIDNVFTDDERNLILMAIDEYDQNTIIRFKEYDLQYDSDYIHITGNDSGCWSSVGRLGGHQQLNLQRGDFGCLSHGTIIHELLHALGFYHQQNVDERDDYVKINWTNIEEGKERYFEKYDASTTTSFGVPYDYDSVMHYGPCAFSTNGLPTIEPKDTNATIGQRDGLSAKDIEKLEKMYTDVCEKQSAWERSGKFEGDIMLTGEQVRNGMNNTARRWPNKVVPFVIDNVFTDDERNLILMAIDEYDQNTIIRFKEYDLQYDSDYIHITGNDSGCWSSVGRLGGHQQLNLQRGDFGCLSHGTIIHELLHALGFYHQQNVDERDDYVKINWTNIEEGKERYFEKYDASTTTSFGVPYDYDSVMHYGPCAFSTNGLPTIEPKDTNATIGQRDGLSAKDIEKLEKMYTDVCEKQSAWERSGKFEGDIMLTGEQVRNGMNNTARRWPNKVVPFVIDNVFTDDERNLILMAIDEYDQNTIIRFKEYDLQYDSDYIHITGNDSGCWSYVGRLGGHQQLNLQRGDFGCLSHDTIIHELLHALGFYHQQNVDERDDYVKINWTNIEEGKERYFEKYDASTITSFGVPYDYDSVMHYGPCAFSKNGLPTIEPKDTNATIGQRDGLSAKDIEKLEKMYTDVCEKQSAWERSGKFEGDIMLTGEQMRNGLNNTARRWPNKVVPFVIDNVFTDDERNQILMAIDEYDQNTIIRFKEYDLQYDSDYIHITGNDSGCWSYVGRLGGHQQLNLQRGDFGCLSHDTIIHELLHALGFYHQQNVDERDDYVKINWTNIEEGKERYFEKYDASTITSFGVPYDYDSVMHYGPCAFSTNGLPTIEPKDTNATIGQRDGLSAKDIEKLEKMYTDVCEKQSAWERSGKFEGDIMLTGEQMRNGLNNTARRWPNKVVPFVIDNVFTDDERNQILMAIDEYDQNTIIRFKEYDLQYDSDYIHITGNDSGCWSYVGRLGGHQQLNLQRGDFGCLSHDTIIHELLHALGFYHQQNVDERDDYVKINWTNIEEGKERYFEKYDASTITSFGVPYDYDSVMHYGPCAFSTNGLPTIEPKDTNATIGQRDGLSAKDIEKLEKMYTDVCEKQSAWERSGKFEGDIMLTGEQVRNGMNNTARRWPNKVVPFVIDNVFTDDERNLILMAIDEYDQNTIIRFKEYDLQYDSDYIHITGNDSGCWSYVGRLGGHQQLNLQRGDFGCLSHDTIIHELLHALGFYHQQNVDERDDYVKINWTNIEEGKERYFEKYDASTITSFGVPYDYDSVMHYGPCAFSKNGLPTIEPKDTNATIGQRDGLSAKDIEKLEKMYTDVCEKQSAWERSGKFEGDIMLTGEQMRNGLNNTARRWPNKVVPFVIDNVFTDDERNQILMAIDEYDQNTIIRFKEYDLQYDSDYIHITGNDSGCWSYVGRLGGHQQLNLQRGDFGCLSHDTIIHELLHALGFYHQQNVDERDDYVKINWTNIEEGKERYFEKYDASTITSFGVPYDYDSVMHYGPCAFSTNGLPTIEPKDTNATIGQRDGLSAKDIEKLEKMYTDVCEKQSAWERSGKFEGDIMLTGEQMRNGLNNTARRWPNKVVPFVIDNVFTDDERNQILMAIDEYDQNTIIRFKEYDLQYDSDYIHITGNDSGCWSYVGRLGGHQQLNLQRGDFGCLSHDTIIHELLHALGFYHQQNVDERDDYVKINWTNIEEGKERYFEKYDASTIASFGVPYDYDSVMHYGPCAFSTNGLPTIEPKDTNATIGQRDGLSAKDIEKLEKMYTDVCEKQSAWERSGKFEGDIMLTGEQMRNGLNNTARRWPNKVVPFVIDNVFTDDERNQILMAIDEYDQNTIIRFKEYDLQYDSDYIHITGNDSGCWSHVGRLGGHQQLNLQRGDFGCLSHGTIIHELLHALGFYHQQNVDERDDYVKINWTNIEEGKERYFEKYDARTITSFGVPYDYDSVMHYGHCAFSTNGLPTIEPKDTNATIGQRDGLSAKDIEKLEKMYTDVCEKQSAWERSGKFEGDIMLTGEQMRNGLNNTARRWPNKVVPFVIDNVFTDDERNQILMAIDEYDQNTIIRFKEYDLQYDSDYIHITGNDSGCWSYVGRLGGRQQLNLQRGEFGCISHGTIIHELLHALGFYHQHNVDERDDYVKINWTNIEEEKRKYFQKYNPSTITSFGVPYDYDSVMHYGPCAFSINGSPTIQPTDPNATIGQRDRFSARDIEKLARMYPDVCDKQSAWERSGKFEGDIILTDEQLRNGLINTANRWPNKVVPFVIDKVFTDDERSMILLAIDDYHRKTPIRFKYYEPMTDSDYINITGNDSGCWSYVGRLGGRQQLNLQRGEFGCLLHGTIIHELLHALGFYHQHSATERDDYVTINRENIQPGMEHNFEKYNASTITNFGVPYDYDSVMHYGPCAFSKNGLPTIEPKDPNATIGQTDGFSEKDIDKVAKMYKDICERQSAWERSGKFEGDIMLTDEQQRNGLIKLASRWANKVVPFVIDNVFTDVERSKILLAIDDCHQKTPIRFKYYEPLTDSDYIRITGEGSGCWSYVGRIGGRQQLNLQRGEFGCISHGTIIHELLHALGFYHQHSATDRDDYVTINWQNIETGKEKHFEKYDASTITSFGVPYDYGSVMHYGSCAFSKNGLKTIEPKNANVTIGQTEGFSKKDIEKLKKMYDNSSYATRPQFITLIIITLNIFTHLQ